jgi:hypothetical protein
MVHNPDFGVWLERTEHTLIHNGAHPVLKAKYGGKGWNQIWIDFFKGAPTRQETLDKARQLAGDLGWTKDILIPAK